MFFNIRQIYFFMSVGLSCVGKNGSFGFSALGCVSAKTKCAICGSAVFFTLTHNGLWVAAVGDFEALHCQPALNLNRSTKLRVYRSYRLPQNAVSISFSSLSIHEPDMLREYFHPDHKRKNNSQNRHQ